MEDIDQQQFDSELRVHEALDVASTTPVFALSILMAFFVLLLQIGPVNLTMPAIGSLFVMFVINMLGLKSYYALRHKPRPKKISRRRFRIILITSIILGMGWGSFNFFMMPFLPDHEQMALYLFAFIGAFGGATTFSLRVTWGFSSPILFLSWLSMSLWGPLTWYINTLTIAGTILAITQLTSLTRRSAKNGIKLALANTKALNDQLAAEEELRRAEAEAARSEQLHQSEQAEMKRALINVIPFPLVLTSGNDALEITPQARAQFALNDTQLNSFTLTQFFVDPEEQHRMLEIVNREGLIDDYEVLMRNLKGEQFWVTISMRPLQYNKRDCWLNAIYVIDARKRIEQDLANSKEQAEHALADLKAAQESLIHVEKMASLGQLTAGIAHEIKNPLNFVNNFAKLSAEMINELVELLQVPLDALNENDREDADDLIKTVVGNLEKIESHGQRADSIVKNMLLLSREGSSEMQRVSLNMIVKEAVNLAYHGARAADKSFNIDVQTNFSDDVADVDCLPQELQRVVLNMCSNGMYEAVKASRARGDEPVLKVATRRTNDRYEVCVLDNGGGIPEEMRDKIFDPFFTTKPTAEGTGLGLSLSFDIVKQHGGLLTFESELGIGTEFLFDLPMVTEIDPVKENV